MERCCGLVTDKKETVPLRSVEVDVQVQGHVATVSSSLLYLNQDERPLEAVFVFPLPAECALCHFGAKLGDVEVVAKLQDKQRASTQGVDDALSSGKPAFLLEEKEQGSNVFQLTVGSLPPGQSAAITLVYISELAMQADDALRFCLPTVFNPLYTPQDMDQSPMVATITSMPADGVPYTLAVRAQVSSPQRISKVESNCSLEPLEYLNSDQTEAKVSLSSGYKFDRDVELLFYYQDAHKSTAIVEAGQESAEPGSLMHDPVVMLSCYPELPVSETGEFIFVMDRSCSMDSKMHSGKDAKKRIDSAKDTLLLLLKSLPMGCYFNIYGFGTNFEHIFPKSVEYNQETLDEALAKVKGMRANMGGTEILPPMEHIYSLPCVPNHPRQLFIFTDGEVGIGNTKVALNLVKADVNPTRCFSFGIGEGASTAFITGLAKEGSGHAQFITGKDRMQPKVMQSLRYALHPTAKDISVDWNLPDGVSVSTLSPLPTFLFHGHRALLYAQLKGESPGIPEGSVTIQYSQLEQTVRNQLGFTLQPAGGSGVTVHRLGARALMRSMELEERAGGAQLKDLQQKLRLHLNTGDHCPHKALMRSMELEERARGAQVKDLGQKLLELSLQSGVRCAHTTFVASHKASGKTVQGPLLHRTVPTPGMGHRMTRLERPPSPRQVLHDIVRRDIRALVLYDSSDDEWDEECAFSAGYEEHRGSLHNYTYSTVGLAAAVPNHGLSEPKSTQITDLPLQLVSLQNATGSWHMGSSLAKMLGKTEDELTKAEPKGVDQAVWATVLALIWLYGFQLKACDEWQLVAMKAASWIQDQKGGSAGISQCVEAGNALLGCTVAQKTLGL